MPSAAERALVIVARLCAVAVVSIAPVILVVLLAATIVSIFRGPLAIGMDLLLALFGSTLALGLIGATAGTALGVGAALFAIEIASPLLRQLIKALVGGLHAIPAVGFGLAAAGILLATRTPSVAQAYLLAMLVMVIMIASVVFVQTRRELGLVPAGVREAASAVGADAVQTALHGVLPAIRRKIAGIWWASLALALGEGTALSMIFMAARDRATGTLASVILGIGASDQGSAVIGLAPAALVLLGCVIAASILGRRATGSVSWP